MSFGLDDAAAALGIYQMGKDILGFGGGDTETTDIQKQIGKFLLQQARQQNSIRAPFQGQLADLLRKRTGQVPAISNIGTSAFQPALLKAALSTRQVDPASFLGRKAVLPTLAVPAAPAAPDLADLL